MGALRTAWTTLVPIIEAVGTLPFNGNGVQEKTNGDMALNEEGVWVFSFTENYTYPANGFDDKPLSSNAEIILGIQARRKTLNAIVDNKPQQAMMDMAEALRLAIEAASAAGTFRAANPAFSARYVDADQIFADALDLGVIQVTLALKGFV